MQCGVKEVKRQEIVREEVNFLDVGKRDTRSGSIQR